MLLLFTRLSHDRPLYNRDILNVICWPERSTIRFSYRGAWLTQQVTSKREDGGLSGMDAMIVFCEDEPGDGGGYRFVPIRLAKVVRQEPDSEDGLTLDLELGGFPDVDRVLDEPTWEGLGNLDVPHGTGGKYALLTSAPLPCELAPWRTFMEAARKLRGLDECTFFSLHSPPDTEPMFPRELGAGEDGWIVIRGVNQLDLRIQVCFGSSDKLHQMPTASLDERLGYVVGPYGLRQRGAGVEAGYTIVFGCPSPPHAGMLRIALDIHGRLWSPELVFLVRVEEDPGPSNAT